MSRWMIVGATLVAAGRAAAAPETGFPVRNATELAAICAGTPPGVSTPAAREPAITFCHGYAQGVVSVLLHENARSFCIPNPAPSRTQTMGEYQMWVHAKPERGGTQAAASLEEFFKERFPCQG